jgi:hypothetical protein
MTECGVYVKVSPICYVIQRHSYVCVILIHGPTASSLFVMHEVVFGMCVGLVRQNELMARVLLYGKIRKGGNKKKCNFHLRLCGLLSSFAVCLYRAFQKKLYNGIPYVIV